MWPKADLLTFPRLTVPIFPSRRRGNPVSASFAFGILMQFLVILEPRSWWRLLWWNWGCPIKTLSSWLDRKLPLFHASCILRFDFKKNHWEIEKTPHLKCVSSPLKCFVNVWSVPSFELCPEEPSKMRAGVDGSVLLLCLYYTTLGHRWLGPCFNLTLMCACDVLLVAHCWCLYFSKRKGAFNDRQVESLRNYRSKGRLRKNMHQCRIFWSCLSLTLIFVPPVPPPSPPFSTLARRKFTEKWCWWW